MRHYLDHAATTPMRQAAIDAWVTHAGALNPGGQYGSGRASRSVLDTAREQVAELLGADPVEVLFTASGTEADNIAVQGLYEASPLRRVVTTAIEHPAVGETVAALARRGAQVEKLLVDATGHLADLTPLDEPAAVVACMYANNETGAILAIDEVIARAHGPVHVDAVQVVGRLPIDFHELGATTLAASAHKFGGPRGVGILLARRSPAPLPVTFGGGQERGIRPGTVDVAGAAATAAALAEALAEREAEQKRLAGLRDELLARIRAEVDDVLVNTVEPALPGHLSVSFPGAEGDSLIMLLDSLGVEAATGSACHSGVNRASETLLAMGVPEKVSRGTIRFTLGHTTDAEDIAAVGRIIGEVVERARRAGMA